MDSRISRHRDRAEVSRTGARPRRFAGSGARTWGAAGALLLVTSASWLAAAPQDPATDEAAATGSSEEGQPFTEPGESGAVLPEMTVEAENQVRQSIEKGTFELKLTAALVDSFFTQTDEDALSISPVSGLQPHLNNLERLASEQPPHYWLREMAGQPVATFYPEKTEGHKPKKWTITVTDFRGTPFKSFEGSGRPPEALAWDGRGDDREILEPGYPYSYVFSMTDKGTNTYNHAGVSFRIPALDYREDGDRILEMAGAELFEEFEFELAESGESWLTKACDIIRAHPYSPVRVEVVAEMMDLAEKRAEVVANYMATSLIVPPEQIETEATQRPDLRAEMDGTVTVIIEHTN